MSTLTKVLKLFKWDTKTDGSEGFDINKALNENIDKIDKNAEEVNTKIINLENKNTTNEKDISNIKEDITTTKQTEISEEITVEDCAGVCGKLDVVNGKTEQETRTSNNMLKITRESGYTQNGVTITDNGDGTLTFNGTATSAMNFYFANGTNMYPTSKYYFTGSTNFTQRINEQSGSYTGGNALLTTVLYNTDTNSWYWAFRNDMSYTPKYNGYVTATQIDMSEGVTFNNWTIFPQLEVGSVATEPKPYGDSPSPEYPSPIRNVGDNINLINENEKLNYTTYGSNTRSTTLRSSTEFVGYLFKCEPNTNYVISREDRSSDRFRAFCFDENPTNLTAVSTNGAYGDDNGGNVTEITLKTTENSKFIYVAVGHNNIIQKQVKAEIGTKATGYSKYGCGSIDFKLKNQDNSKSKIVSFPFAEGQVLHDKECLSENIHQIKQTCIFDGTEYTAPYHLEEWTEDYISFWFQYSNKYKLMKQSTTDKCSHLIRSANLTIAGKITENLNRFYIHPNGSIYVVVSTSLTPEIKEQYDKYKAGTANQNTVANAFKNWIAQQYQAGTPFTFEGTLAEEIITPYTKEQEKAYYELQHLLMYEGYTNITCLDEIKPDMQLTYYQNNAINNTYAKRMDEIEKRVRALEVGE